MNKDDLQQRIDTINNQMTVLKSNYAQLEGHLAEANFWLEEVKNKEQEINNTNIEIAEE